MESLAEKRMQNDPSFTSLHHFFLNSANNIHNLQRPYLFQKEKGEWREYTYEYLLQEINKAAAFFVNHG